MGVRGKELVGNVQNYELKLVASFKHRATENPPLTPANAGPEARDEGQLTSGMRVSFCRFECYPQQEELRVWLSTHFED